jgi:hypothetical protein
MLRRTRHQLAIAIPIVGIFMATGIVYWITSRPADDNPLPLTVSSDAAPRDASPNNRTTASNNLATTAVPKSMQDGAVGSN